MDETLNSEWPVPVGAHFVRVGGSRPSKQWGRLRTYCTKDAVQDLKQELEDAGSVSPPECGSTPNLHGRPFILRTSLLANCSKYAATFLSSVR